MGIKFLCPNGHKLNVKTELAGRKGRCPSCGVSLLVPTESVVEKTVELAESDENRTIALTGTLVPKIESSDDPEYKAAPDPTPMQSNEPLPVGGSGDVWYIQVPGGPQFGPATGDVVNDWIKERRIAPAMLVWKEGWSDWRVAGTVFNELSESFPSVSETANVKNGLPKVELTARFRQKSAKMKKRSKQLAWIVILSFAVLILGGLLLYLLRDSL